jgi:hypothetical protein
LNSTARVCIHADLGAGAGQYGLRVHRGRIGIESRALHEIKCWLQSVVFRSLRLRLRSSLRQFGIDSSLVFPALSTHPGKPELGHVPGYFHPRLTAL